jgi:hypothetical protein
MALTADSKQLYIPLTTIYGAKGTDGNYTLSALDIKNLNDDLWNIVKKIQGNLTLADLTELAVKSLTAVTVITENLYATYGDISELTVDRLKTDPRVERYWESNTDDINYISIQEQYIKFITGSTDGSTTQHTDRNGNLLYYYGEVTAETYKTVGMSTTETAYPVTVYAYTELVKTEISFIEVDGNYIPQIILGAGAGVDGFPERGKGYVFKDEFGLLLRYIKADGTVVEFRIGESGIEFLGDTTINYYSATNSSLVTVNSSGETIVCTKDIAFPNRSKAIINFSCTILTSGGALNATAKVYVDGVALTMQPKAYQASANSWVISFCDDKKAIYSGTKTVAVKIVTDANSGTVAIGQSKMIVQVFADPLPPLHNPTDFEATAISFSQINLAWANPTATFWDSVELYRHTSDLSEYDRDWCDANATLIYSGTSTGYNNTGLSESTTYYYKIFGKYDIEGDIQFSTGLSESGTTPVSPYQQWPEYPQSPLLTSEYPYQAIGIRSGVPQLLMSEVKLIQAAPLALLVTYNNQDMQQYTLQGGVWTYLALLPSRTNVDLSYANNDVYTDATLTTVSFAKNTP